jgi:hypothetical protein
MTNNVEVVAAWIMGGDRAVPFASIPVGHLFRKTYSALPTVYVKKQRGWYRDGAGNKSRARPAMPCIPVGPPTTESDAGRASDSAGPGAQEFSS